MGFYYGFRGEQKLRFPLKNLKAGEYSVTIRVFRNSRFRKLRGRTTLSVKVPVRVKLKFQQCETPRSPVWLQLTMKPGLKGSTRCDVRKDGKVVLRFKGTPGASLVVDGQTQVIKETGIARVEISVLPLLMRSPLKAIAAPLPVRRSKKYRSSYVSISGFKSFFKRFTAVLTYKKKKLKHTISLESSPNCFKASARLVMRMMQRGVNVPTNPGAKALFYFEGPYTIWTTERTKTLGDVRFYAVRRYVGRRNIRTCRYNRGIKQWDPLKQRQLEAILKAGTHSFAHITDLALDLFPKDIELYTSTFPNLNQLTIHNTLEIEDFSALSQFHKLRDKALVLGTLSLVWIGSRLPTESASVSLMTWVGVRLVASRPPWNTILSCSRTAE